MATSKEKNQELHVLMVAFSAQGHINPLLRLGNSLISKGLHITLATTEAVYHRMFKSSSTTTTSAAAAAVPTSVTINGIHVLFFSDGFNSQEERKNTNMDQYMERIETFGPRSLSKLMRDHFLEAEEGPKLNSRRLACIINNPFVPWVADVAAEAGIPCACLWIQPCALYAIYYRFYANLNQFPTVAEPERDVELPGFPLLRPQDLPSFVLPSNPFGSIPKMFSEVFHKMKDKLKWVLANSFYELEKEVIDSMAELCPILPVGPLVPPSLISEDDRDDQKQDVGIEMWKPQDSCMEWLSNKPPSSVIYISFGSLIVLSSKEVESIAKALKNSKRHFLWVMKAPEKATSDGAGELPLGFLEETKDQGLIVSWCPQTKVLSHPSIACFLTHCGWNSMLEAITAGTPMVAYPKWTDQPTNAKLVSDVFRTGARLQPAGDGFVGHEEVERAIEEVVGGPSSEEIKKNAEKLKRAAREAVADGGSSDRNIQLFVDEIIGSHRR